MSTFGGKADIDRKRSVTGGNNQLAGSNLSAKIALSVRTNKLHSAEAAAAEPSVTEGYQCQAETQSRGGR
jgi:hypothetical protein